MLKQCTGLPWAERCQLAAATSRSQGHNNWLSVMYWGLTHWDTHTQGHVCGLFWHICACACLRQGQKMNPHVCKCACCNSHNHTDSSIFYHGWGCHIIVRSNLRKGDKIPEEILSGDKKKSCLSLVANTVDILTPVQPHWSEVHPHEELWVFSL